MGVDIGKRIRSARRLRQMSQQSLADIINLSKNMISKYEKGLNIPNSTTLIAISTAVDLKLDYFVSSMEIDLGEIKFRKKSKFGVKAQESLKEEVKYFLENYLTIEKILGVSKALKNPISDKIIDSKKSIIDAVRIIREDWNIGMDPVHKVIQIFEHQGIKVFEVDNNSKFDGFSTYINDTIPMIVINKNWKPERKRFTLLHELGHLFLNIPKILQKKEENFCNFFAGEFLLPQKAVQYEFGQKRKRITMSELESVQKNYGISIGAQLFRLKDNDYLSQDSLTQFYRKINFDSKLKEQVNKSRFSSDESTSQFEQYVYRAIGLELISISKASFFLNKDVAVLEEEISKF